MVLGISNWPIGLLKSPAGAEGLGVRAALFSFGFLLRRAAADYLDVHEREIKVGVRVLRDAAGDIIGQVFISDSLENGAGYASLLGQPHQAERLLQYVLGQPPQAPTFYGFLVSTQHAGPGTNACRTSCPDCLRDFSNLPYHPILDWRLGLDIARLALDPAAPIDFTVPYWQGLDAAVAGPYFAAMPGWRQMTISGLQAGSRGNVVEIITHPLWDCAPSAIGVATPIHGGTALSLAVEVEHGTVPAGEAISLFPLDPSVHEDVVAVQRGDRVRVTGLWRRADGSVISTVRTLIGHDPDIPRIEVHA